MMDFQPSVFLEDSNMSNSSGLSSSDIGGIEATDLTSLLSQFEEASQSLDGLTPPESVQSTESIQSNEKTQPPVIKTKPAQAVQNKTPVNTPPATPPLEILERIRAKRKRKLAIMLPTMLPAKIQKSNTNTANSENLLSTNNLVQNELPLKQGILDVNSNYFNHIPDHDYCVNSPRMSPKRDSPCISEPTPVDAFVPMPDDVVNEIVIDAGDTCELNCDLKDEVEEGEVIESPTKVVHPKSGRDTNRSRSRITSKLKDRSRRNYRRRGDSPVESRDHFFDKIPAYFTTLSKPSKMPKRDSGFLDSGIRTEDFIERDSSPSRTDPSLFNKLPAYYSCFTNSTKYDNSTGGQESYDLEDLDDYPRARKPRRYRSSSRSRSRSRSYSRSRSRSQSRQRSYNRRRSYSSESGSSSSSSSRSRSRSYSRSLSRSRSRSHSRSRFRSRSYSRHSSRSSYSRYSRSYSRSRSRSRSRSYERIRAERKKLREEEKNRQIEERRIVYVGKIPDGYTRRDLRRRFSRFGEIEEVSVHFREGDDNYGFVTFGYTCDAYAAIEKGNDIPGEKHVDLCFGGRRQFCDTDYADLDKKTEVSEEFSEFPRNDPLDFDQLLKQARLQQKRKR